VSTSSPVASQVAGLAFLPVLMGAAIYAQIVAVAVEVVAKSVAAACSIAARTEFIPGREALKLSM